MRLLRWSVVLLSALAMLASPAPVRAEPPAGDIIDYTFRPEGQGFCFGRNIVIAGGFIIQGQRCYNFYLVRTDNGGFLGLGPSGPTLVPAGQVIRLNTPAGDILQNSLYYLIPLPVIPTALPIHGAQFITVQVSGQAGRLVILVPRAGVGGARPIEVGFTQP